MSGSLTAPLQNALPLDVRFSQFAALATKMHQTAFPRYTWINLAPNVQGYSRGSDWFSPYVLDAFAIPAMTTDVSTSVTYGDPFPANWDRLAEVWMGFGTPLVLPGTAGGMATASIRVRVPVSELGNGVVPVIEPVGAITIDGRSATQPQTVSALTPEISWQPPAVGVAAGYFVTIEEAYAENGWTVTAWVAQVVTEQTSFNVPPGVFDHGKTYDITVSAVADSAWKPAGNGGIGGVASAICEIVTVQ